MPGRANPEDAPLFTKGSRCIIKQGSDHWIGEVVEQITLGDRLSVKAIPQQTVTFKRWQKPLLGETLSDSIELSTHYLVYPYTVTILNLLGEIAELQKD